MNGLLISVSTEGILKKKKEYYSLPLSKSALFQHMKPLPNFT